MNKINVPVIWKIALVFVAVFILQLLLGLFALYGISMHQVQGYITQTTKRIQSDIIFQYNSWDLSRYNADPDVPDTYPIYILGSDGYVIDRWKPIHGFLDTSDIKHLLTYTSPQTIATSTEQVWRIYSKPIIVNGQTLGVITVAMYDPSQDQILAVDQRLLQTAANLQAKLSIKNNTISVGTIDTRDVSYDISFQIVDRFNKIIAKNNNTNSIDRIPNFIDVSYVGDLLSSPNIQKISDSQTGEKFLFLTTPLVHNNTVMGVMVVGRSISYIDDLLRSFLLLEGVLGIGLCAAGVYLTLSIIKHYVQDEEPEEKFHEVKKISFNKKNSSLVFDQIELPIPYSTNQYYLCETLFSSPKKRWETDELLKRFGDHTDQPNWRKTYDTMISINKKSYKYLRMKLIINKDKTYQINPHLISKIV